MPKYPLQRVLDALSHHEHATDTDEPGSRAAVSAILRERDPSVGAELMLIRRSEDPRDPWSGNLAFPGGRKDPEDVDLRATALRETLEEIGLDLTAKGSLLYRMPDVPATARGKRVGMVIAPFTYVLSDPEPALTLNNEVSEIHWVSLDYLTDPANYRPFYYVWEGEKLELPSIHIAENRVLWGLTWKMTVTLLELIGE